MRHSTAKQRRHISPGILSTADQTSGFGKHLEDNAPFTAQTTVDSAIALLLCVCVYPFQAFLWSDYKGLFSGWGDVTLTTKAYVSCYKYTAPADEVVITEQACSAKVTMSGDKGRGGGPVERAEPLFPCASVCLADPHLVRTER